MKSILKSIIHVLKLIEKNFECFTSKPNAHGTFWNLHIKINLKINIFFFFFFFFFFAYLHSPNLGLTPPGTYKPNARTCRGCNSLWTRTPDRYTRAGLPECVLSTMSGPPPKTTQDRTQIKDTHPIPGQILKFLTPPGNPTRAAELEGRDSTDHATATN